MPGVDNSILPPFFSEMHALLREPPENFSRRVHTAGEWFGYGYTRRETAPKLLCSCGGGVLECNGLNSRCTGISVWKSTVTGAIVMVTFTEWRYTMESLMQYVAEMEYRGRATRTMCAWVEDVPDVPATWKLHTIFHPAPRNTYLGAVWCESVSDIRLDATCCETHMALAHAAIHAPWSSMNTLLMRSFRGTCETLGSVVRKVNVAEAGPRQRNLPRVFPAAAKACVVAAVSDEPFGSSVSVVRRGPLPLQRVVQVLHAYPCTLAIASHIIPLACRNLVEGTSWVLRPLRKTDEVILNADGSVRVLWMWDPLTASVLVPRISQLRLAWLRVSVHVTKARKTH